MPSYARETLSELLTPATCALLTVECQRGVVGPDGALPELAAAARETGALDTVARLVSAAHDTPVQ
ncbi:cysteine hydrolase, partial [Streptomyces sp. 2MCAF27]